MFTSIKNTLSNFKQILSFWLENDNEFKGLDFNQIRAIKKIDTLRKVNWATKERYNQPLNSLYEECMSQDHL